MDLATVTDLVPAPGAAWRTGDAWLGGGTWLFSEPQPATTRLLDLASFGWPSLTETDDGLDIAATCTLAELARWRPAPERAAREPEAGGWAAQHLPRHCCAALLGSFKVANVATVGGNICLVFLAAAALATRAACRQVSLSPAGRSAVLLIGTRSRSGATTVTLTAAVPRPVQVRFTRPPHPNVLAQSLDDAVSGTSGYLDDVHGSAPWRRAMTRRAALEVATELSGPGPDGRGLAGPGRPG